MDASCTHPNFPATMGSQSLCTCFLSCPLQRFLPSSQRRTTNSHLRVRAPCALPCTLAVLNPRQCGILCSAQWFSTLDMVQLWEQCGPVLPIIGPFCLGWSFEHGMCFFRGSCEWVPPSKAHVCHCFCLSSTLCVCRECSFCGFSGSLPQALSQLTGLTLL